MAKIDFRVVPFLCVLYLLAFLDRVNIGNARSFGLAKDLNLQNTQYNTGRVYSTSATTLSQENGTKFVLTLISSHHVFRPIRCLRDPVKCADEEIHTACLALGLYVHVWTREHLSRAHFHIRRTSDDSIFSWDLRIGNVPRLLLLDRNVV